MVYLFTLHIKLYLMMKLENRVNEIYIMIILHLYFHNQKKKSFNLTVTLIILCLSIKLN